MQLGFQNEKNFILALDNKKLKDVSKDFQNLFFSLFKNIDMNSKIECWKSKYLEKADIKIRINGIIKGISIKTGHNCSVHQENLDKILCFFTKIGIDENINNMFKNYIKGYVNNVRVDAKTYIENNMDEIKIIKATFNEIYTKANLIMRFIFQGTELQKYDADALVYGTPDNFIWATKNEIFKYLLNCQSDENNYLSIGALYIKCYDRNLRNNPKKTDSQNQIQVKWYTLPTDLLYITKLREAKQIKMFSK